MCTTSSFDSLETLQRSRDDAWMIREVGVSAAGVDGLAIGGTLGREARQLARQIKSDRQQRRLRRLILPGSP